MADCLFCRIVKNEVPSYTVYEDDHTRAFLDIMPSVAGHAMVIHKKHGDTLLDYTPVELGQLFYGVQKVVKALERTYRTTIFTIGINHGEPSGVHHLRIHILPRFGSDHGGIIQNIVKGETVEDLVATANKIRKRIGKT